MISSHAKNIPPLVECFIQRLESERLLPRGWRAKAMYYHSVPGNWTVELCRGAVFMGHVSLCSLEKNIAYCLDKVVPMIVERNQKGGLR